MRQKISTKSYLAVQHKESVSSKLGVLEIMMLMIVTRMIMMMMLMMMLMMMITMMMLMMMSTYLEQLVCEDWLSRLGSNASWDVRKLNPGDHDYHDDNDHDHDNDDGGDNHEDFDDH